MVTDTDADLETGLNYLWVGYVYTVTCTDFNQFGIHYGVTDTDLAFLIPSFFDSYRHSFCNWKVDGVLSVIQSVIAIGAKIITYSHFLVWPGTKE